MDRLNVLREILDKLYDYLIDKTGDVQYKFSYDTAVMEIYKVDASLYRARHLMYLNKIICMYS